MNHTAVTILDLLVIISCIATCLRLLVYRRNGSNFKRSVSVLAYVLISATGGTGLLIITGKLSSADINPVIILALCVLTLLVYRARGNVSQLLRPEFYQEIAE